MVKKKLDEIAKLKKEARRCSIKEGIFSSARMSFGDYYISPFAIAINASNSLVSLLSAIQGLLGPLSQIFGSHLVGKMPRKQILRKYIFIEALMWLPMILIAILFSKNIITNILPLLLIFTFSLYTIFSSVGHPAWFSWMGDIVEESNRSKWFSKRNLITGFVSVILAVGAAFFLDYFKSNNKTMAGFVILFSLAGISRLIGWKIFKRKYEPELIIEEKDYFSFSDFIINAKNNNFGRYTIFRGLFAFAISITSPLVVVYLLRYLNFNYTTYIIIAFSGTIISLLLLELWGKIADKYGTYRVLGITTIFVPLTPLLWILSPNPIYLILVPSAIGATAWEGFLLASESFIYDNVQPTRRSTAISYFNMVVGIGVFLGACVGAFLIKYLQTTMVEPIIVIFFIGTFARMLVVAFWIPKIKEIRKTAKFHGAKTLKKILIKDFKPTLSEEFHEIASIKKYFK